MYGPRVCQKRKIIFCETQTSSSFVDLEMCVCACVCNTCVRVCEEQNTHIDRNFSAK